MINKRYFDFLEDLNENVQQAKVYLKNLALKKKKSNLSGGDDKVSLSIDEVREAETNPNFVKIKDMCRDNPGYTYLFTKIFFEEYEEDVERFTDLQNLYNEIKSLGNLVKELPMALDRYAAIKPSDDDQRPISERITDDIEKIKIEKSYKKFYNELLPHQKKWVEDAIQQQKEKLRDIGIAFNEMGKNENGTVDEKRQKSLQRVYFSKLKDFKKLDELIDYAINYLKSINNNQFSKFMEKIDEVNTKFGSINGAKIIYDKDGYLVIEVNSYVANRELNGHTSHCIARSGSYWDNYLQDFNKQYYVYNFNIDPSDRNSVIGMTIKPNGEIKAAHDKLDGNVFSTFKSIIKGWNVPYDLFEPMTKKEIEEKKIKLEASKKIILTNLSIEEAIKALDDGADPNARSGIPLKNAVKSDNLELVKVLLKRGALPNMTEQNSTDTAITHATNLEMVKVLVSAGATLNSSVFRNVANDSEAIEYLLKSGMDPNFDRGFPFRAAAKNNDIVSMDLFMKYADNIKLDEKVSIKEKQLILLTERRYMAIKWAAERLNLESTIFILDKLKELEDKSMDKPEEFVMSLIEYVQSSDASSNQNKPNFIASLKNWLKSKSESIKESKKIRNFKSFLI